MGFLQSESLNSGKKLETIYNMYAIAYSYFKNKYDAEDAVAECFVKIAEKLDMVGDPSSIKTKALLSVITKNTCINILRQNKMVSFIEDVDFVDSIASDENVSDRLDKEETQKEIAAAIGKLNDTYKDALTSFVLDISYQTAQKRIKRGEQLLVKLLKDKGVL